MFKLLEKKFRIYLTVTILLLLFIFFALIFSSYVSVLDDDFVQKSTEISNYIAKGVEQKINKIEQSNYMFMKRFDIKSSGEFDPLYALRMSDYWAGYDYDIVAFDGDTVKPYMFKTKSIMEYELIINTIRKAGIYETLKNQDDVWVFSPEINNLIYALKIDGKSEYTNFIAIGIDAGVRIIDKSEDNIFFKENMLVKITLPSGDNVCVDINGIVPNDKFPDETYDTYAEIVMSNGIKISAVILKNNLYNHILSYLLILLFFYIVISFAIVVLLNMIIKNMITPMQELYDKMNNFDMDQFSPDESKKSEINSEDIP